MIFYHFTNCYFCRPSIYNQTISEILSKISAIILQLHLQELIIITKSALSKSSKVAFLSITPNSKASLNVLHSYQYHELTSGLLFLISIAKLPPIKPTPIMYIFFIILLLLLLLFLLSVAHNEKRT